MVRIAAVIDRATGSVVNCWVKLRSILTASTNRSRM